MDKSRGITNHPIFVIVEPIGDDTGAHIRPLYSCGDRTTAAYEITIDSDYYHTSDVIKLKHIICHELAHIAFPRTEKTEHPPRFQNLAKHLGAGKYIVSGMG
jgi:predicted SprT family Zn-dependent metalloprotease